ncbi:helix-turn-helix domain-containing protein [Defluviimonas salinarum]|uniref:Helix-turn-helix transcriptional regulator n=1 Tax=Defluviimonas salinarum TaxID=2992147 RepID=A0ABT3J1J5_9RHOB|nr:helix-turn-helix transcriptional regulator [Defluviimonas salinarum]MCW3781565.1 helix-turn-helix transcriptional regulator [Defluviimonas salinarum]
MRRDPIKSFQTPFSFEDLTYELRAARWCSASQAALEGGPEDGIRMLGFEAEFGPNESGTLYVDQIDVSALPITQTFRRAYDFAFQVGDRHLFTEDDRMDLAAYRAGAARGDWEGVTSPVARIDSKLSHVADMALARMNLLHGDALTIRDLCLLANMTEAAVRSALSLDSIKTEGRPASLRAEVAEAWLKGRRGYVPTSDSGSDGYADRNDAFADMPIREGLQHLIDNTGFFRNELAERADIPVETFDRLYQGDLSDLTMPVVLRIARALSVDPPEFVSWIARKL